MEIKGKAIVLTNGVYNTKSAKTAHGLVRGSSRFDILGIIDNKFYDNDAGKLLDGKHRNIPIYKSLLSFLNPNTINPMDGSFQLTQTSYNVPISGSNPENIVKRGTGLAQFNPFNIPTIQY